ncbi:hypothetical protein SAY86_011810 [Trapa natans]|uniref:cysteine dioxygenase n=1 Tax=Trapa natans TaxID=22666 RepID=A0AAN7RB07_TRANT|nr:hypothetical protein SAY86_011810 [Trapa natans]
MRIGATLVGDNRNHANSSGGGKVRYVSNSRVIRKKRFIRREVKDQRSLPLPMALQELYEACREVFKGPGTVPLPEEVQRLSLILDNMKPEDVGLSKDLQFKTKHGVEAIPKVIYTAIYKCDNFSMCIFFLPSGGVIPLHNHPGMTVLSKLLLGSMHVKSYDWADPTDAPDATPGSSPVRLARVKADGVLVAPCDSSVLYPTTGGNIHAIKALTTCAFLDVLGPPYSEEDGRDCSYYKEHPYTAFSGKRNPWLEGNFLLGLQYGIQFMPNVMLLTSSFFAHADGGIGLGPGPGAQGSGEWYGWLEEIDVPEDSLMVGIEYKGPQIIE